jgi:hypothetical protein
VLLRDADPILFPEPPDLSLRRLHHLQLYLGNRHTLPQRVALDQSQRSPAVATELRLQIPRREKRIGHSTRSATLLLRVNAANNPARDAFCPGQIAPVMRNRENDVRMIVAHARAALASSRFSERRSPNFRASARAPVARGQGRAVSSSARRTAASLEAVFSETRPTANPSA